MIDDLNKGLLRRTLLKGAAASLAAAALTPSNAFAGGTLGKSLESHRDEKLRIKKAQDEIAYQIIGDVKKSSPFNKTYETLGTDRQSVFLKEFQKWVLQSRSTFDSLLSALAAPSTADWDSLVVSMLKCPDLGTTDTEREKITALLQEIMNRAAKELETYTREHVSPSS